MRDCKPIPIGMEDFKVLIDKDCFLLIIHL